MFATAYFTYFVPTCLTFPFDFRTALLHYVDICAIPRTHILAELAKYV